jgi:hypothetical protein
MRNPAHDNPSFIMQFGWCLYHGLGVATKGGGLLGRATAANMHGVLLQKVVIIVINTFSTPSRRSTVHPWRLQKSRTRKLQDPAAAAHMRWVGPIYLIICLYSRYGVTVARNVRERFFDTLVQLHSPPQAYTYVDFQPSIIGPHTNHLPAGAWNLRMLAHDQTYLGC